MRRYLMTLTAGLALTGLAALALPQASATLTLKSGDTVRGEVVDLGAAGFTVLTSGRERVIPMSDVAVIDFGTAKPLAPADLARLWSPGQHLVILRNGASVKGELYDIGGTHPLRVTIKTGDTERDLSSDEIAQIYLAKPAAPAPPSQPQSSAPTGRTVFVSATQAWTATGVTVRAGQTVRFHATGQILLNRSLTATPAGSTSNQRDSRAPLPRSRLGALVGRIGAGGVFQRSTGAFLIGDQSSVAMPASGQLYLGINESVLTDNRGAFTVVVDAGGPPNR